MFATYTGVAGVAQMVALAAFPKISEKIGRGKAFLLASFPEVGFILLLLCGFIPFREASSWLVFAKAVVNIGIGFMLVLITVMLADVVDYGEYKLGTRNESILFSMQTYVKFAGAFSGFVSGIGLTLIGYVPNEAQAPHTIIGMRIIMIASSGTVILLMFCDLQERLPFDRVLQKDDAGTQNKKGTVSVCGWV